MNMFRLAYIRNGEVLFTMLTSTIVRLILCSLRPLILITYQHLHLAKVLFLIEPTRIALVELVDPRNVSNRMQESLNTEFEI